MENRTSAPNRRQWERVPVRGEVKGRIHTVASAPVLDLSENGALIEVTCALRPGSIYALRLLLSADSQLSVRSRVVRSSIHRFERKDGGESSPQYHAALEFVEILEAARETIRRHVGKAEGVLEEEFD